MDDKRPILIDDTEHTALRYTRNPIPIYLD